MASGVATGGGRQTGRNAGRTRRRLSRLLLATTLLSGAMTLLVPFAEAQQAADAAGRPVQFSIPAQPLTNAVDAFVRQSGWQVGYSSRLADGVLSRPVSAAMTPEQALQALLAGSGISVRMTGASVATLMGAQASVSAGAAPGAIVLDTIDVQGDGEYGPTNGFISQDAVAGSKTNTPIIETPFSVSVVNRKQLEIQNPQSLPDALRYTPGVATGFFGADNRLTKGQIYIRGFGDDATSPLYWDGLYLPSDLYVNSPALEPYNLERIEVLRGPASVLYGQASPGGIINARSKLPTATPIREVIVGTGNYGRAYSAFDVGGPVDGSGQWLYRVSGVGYRTGTQIDDTAYERISIAPSLTWRPSADTRFTILTTYQRDPDGIGFQSLPLVGTLLPSRTGPIPTRLNFSEPSYDRMDRRWASAGYEFEHRVDAVWTVRQNFRYLHADGTYHELQPTGWANAANTVMNRSNWATDGRLDAVAVDNQAQAQFATGLLKHTVLFGLDYRTQWTHNANYWSRVGQPPLNVLNPVYGVPVSFPPMFANTDGRLEQTGLYAQDQIALGNWRFLIGGRQDWAENSTKNLMAKVNPTTTQNSDAFTWRAGAVYLFGNGLAPYASYSTSFQPQGGTDFSGAMFQPTTAQQYEVGLKYQPAGLLSFVQVSLFDLTQQNVLSTDPAHFGFSVQTGEVRVKGVELSTTLALTDNFNLIASYTYNDVETTRANPDAAGFDPTGRVPWYYPRQLASAWADYTFQTGLLTGLRVGGGVRYVGSAYNGPKQQYTVPSYTLIDAAITYDLGAADRALRGWEISVNANNLTDEVYLARCSELNCSYGIRRTILANLKYRW